MSTAVSAFGGLDILVNNAGVGVFKPVAETSVDEWHRVLDTNLSGVFHCCHAAIPHMQRRGGGWIINISSLASKNPFVNGGVYCASKAALNAFSETLMQEVRHDGIRVAYVLPGSVNTGFGGLSNTKSEWALMPEDVAAGGRRSGRASRRAACPAASRSARRSRRGKADAMSAFDKHATHSKSTRR